MAAPPFKVKATFDYSSEHGDDLSFSIGQIITVTEKEDADWYIGEYTDASGDLQSGLFPRNFVERYEPAPPPRPVRAAKPKQPEKPVEQPPPDPEPQIPSPTIRQEPVAAPASEFSTEPVPPPVQKTAEPPVPKPAAAKSPPPVTEKPSSFRDRIAAFNKSAAPPIAPFKPAGLGSSGFIKKPFVAPPPARDAYVPPPREAAPQKVYRRDEDPEIAERQAQDLENAEKAGLVSSGQDEDAEEAPKAVSLKERIALLQKQQMEQAARRSDVVKEKPKRPPKKRADSHEQTETGEHTDIPTSEPIQRGSSDLDREHHEPSRKHSRPSKGVEMFSDGNEADQSAAGETTEEADGASTGADEEEEVREQKTRKPATASEDAPEEDESTEEEMDEEARHQMALRERMAKLSGGMAMAGMFGPPGGMPMMGMGGASKKRKPTERKVESQEETASLAQAPRIPVIPMPVPSRTNTAGSEPGQLSRSTTQRGVNMDDDSTEGPASPPGHVTRTESFGIPPPVPGGRPNETTLTSRSAQLPPSTEFVRFPSPGSESDDEMPGNSLTQDTIGSASSPPVPSRPFPSVPGANQTSSVESIPTRSPSDKRTSRAPPPVPGTGPMQTRPPPPIPTDIVHGRTPRAGADGESAYEGDYDTDIASGVKHKDALKSHARESSLDDSTLTDDPSARPPPPLPPVPYPAASRPVPPPPPPQPPARPSMDTARPVPPPPIPHRSPQPDGHDYDPFNYSGPPSLGRAPSAPKVPSGSAPSMPTPLPPPVPSRNLEEDEDEDEDDEDDNLYNASPRKPADRPPPLPPQAPPVERPAPPPAPPSEPSSPRMTRQSGEEDRPFSARRSVEQSRSSIEQGSIARDADLGRSSKWWVLPNTPPPVFQNRSDIFFEIEESSTKQRGGKTTISKDVYILFQDYSQTVIACRFDAKSPDDVTLSQKHESSPHALRQDQLEEYWTRYGSEIITTLNAAQNSTVGDGSPHALVAALLMPLRGALAPVGTRAFGALVYANLANASVQQFDEIRPGDIVSFRNAKFQGKHGGVMHQKYHLEAGRPDHVGVVVEWDGTKKKIRAAEQGRDIKEGKKGKVGVESFRLGDLRSGEVRVWRVVGRDWVGWEEG